MTVGRRCGSVRGLSGVQARPARHALPTGSDLAKRSSNDPKRREEIGPPADENVPDPYVVELNIL